MDLNRGDFLRARDLVYCLHPSIEVAEEVLFEAFAVYLVFARRGLPPTDKPYIARLTPLQILQRAILTTSLRWEQDQEGARSLRPVYRPNAKVMLVRFVKHLIRYTLFRRDSYPLAVAIGSCLYTYQPYQSCEIAALPREGARYERRNHFKGDVLKALKERFRHVLQSTGSGGIETEAPSDDQRRLIREALTAFAPWDTEHMPPDPNCYLFERLEEPPSEWTRKHALLCTACAGFERLAEECALEDPNHPDDNLRIPVFHTDPPPTPPGPSSLDKPPPLSDADLDAKLQRAHEVLKRDCRRRTESHFTRLLVYIDGREQGRLQPEAPLLRLSGVSSVAVSLAVYGEDTAGLVPLALFDLAEAAEDEHGPSRMLAVLESGATIALALVPHWDQEGELAAWDLDLQWTPAAAVQKDLAWCEAVLTATMQQLELAHMFGREALSEELEVRIRPRWYEVYRIVRQTPGDDDWRVDLLARLEKLCHREGEAYLAAVCRSTRETLIEGQEPPEIAAAISLRGQVPPTGPRPVRWLSPLWRPPLAGVAVTAATIPVQEHTFWLEDGEISLTCEWRAAARQQPATLRLVWRATITRPGELRACFTRPEDPLSLYTEVRLGSALAGERVFSSATLGFDPTQEPWAVRLLIKEEDPPV